MPGFLVNIEVLMPARPLARSPFRKNMESEVLPKFTQCQNKGKTTYEVWNKGVDCNLLLRATSVGTVRRRSYAFYAI